MEPRGYGRHRMSDSGLMIPDEWAFLLMRVEPDADLDEVEFVLLEQDIAFVHEHCRCYYCDRKVPAPLAECECEKAFWDQCSGDLYLVHSFGIERLTQRVVQRQQHRRRARQRAAMLREASGKHVSPADRHALYEAQGGTCYYCGDAMVASGRGRYHHDHFVSLARGGRRDVENAVLACPPCNTHKNDAEGFEYLARRHRRKSKNPPELTRMRRSFHQWRVERGFRPFEELVALSR